jgi:hypothetical protein
VPASRNRRERRRGRQAHASSSSCPDGIFVIRRRIWRSGTRQNVRKARAVKRRASWPLPPLTPKAHDSAVQGLCDSDIDTASGRGEGNQKGTQTRRKRKEKDEDVLPEIGVDGEE